MLGSHQITVDQVGMGMWQGGEDDDDQVDVGCHRFELVARIRAAQFRTARQLGHNHATALVAGAPDHAVTGHQLRQVGAQVAAHDCTGIFAFECLDLDLYAEVGDHQASLFRSQIAAFQLFHGPGFAFRRTCSTFALDFVDTPALAAGELALAHEKVRS
jgi:hypothetical protein